MVIGVVQDDGYYFMINTACEIFTALAVNGEVIGTGLKK